MRALPLPRPTMPSALGRRFTIDRKRAMVSRLLQRRSVSEGLRVPYERVRIRRTKGGKPFEGGGAERTPAVANFNFNVAHEGNYVVLASDPALLVGIDVSAPFEMRSDGQKLGSTLEELRRSFEHSFTDDEWDAMACEPTEVRATADAYAPPAHAPGSATTALRPAGARCAPPQPVH